jgi:thiosulfate/3-mercaptopyruvate sulfurtransferase
MKMSPIIEVNELLKIQHNADLVILDVSNSKNARTRYEAEHLAGAFFIDLNSQLADIKTDYADGGRHPLPDTEVFANTLTALGISKDKHIVIYDDNNGSNAAARCWWMLKSAGHEKVQVLNGGLQQAKKYNFPLSAAIEVSERATEPYQIKQWILPTIEMNEVERLSQDPDYLVVDVRDRDRYAGKTEPIDLIAGHIPGAINIPFSENMDADGLFLPAADLRKKYETIFGNIPAEHIIVHCGSGVTACHTLLALAYAEMKIPKLYVGSWSEWSRNDKKIEKTDA